MPKTVFPTYKIFTDATADLSISMLDGLPSVEIIPMEVEIGGTSYTYGPNGNLSTSRFYQLQREGSFANTSQINPLVYRKTFKSALRNGLDVLYLCFSSGMSSTINNAQMVIGELRDEYPQRRIVCIDSLCASVGEGFLVREAARMQANGFSMEELAKWIGQRRLQVCHWFTVDIFDHLKHGGRVSASSAAVGTVLQIKPMLHVDEEGKLAVMAKPRGRKRAMQMQMHQLEQGWTPELGNLIVIGHGDCFDRASELREKVLARFSDADVHIADIGPIIGAHTGPGMLALIYWGNNR